MVPFILISLISPCLLRIYCSHISQTCLKLKHSWFIVQFLAEAGERRRWKNKLWAYTSPRLRLLQQVCGQFSSHELLRNKLCVQMTSTTTEGELLIRCPALHRVCLCVSSAKIMWTVLLSLVTEMEADWETQDDASKLWVYMLLQYPRRHVPLS